MFWMHGKNTPIKVPANGSGWGMQIISDVVRSLQIVRGYAYPSGRTVAVAWHPDLWPPELYFCN